MQEYEITYLVANEEMLAKKSVEKAVDDAGGKVEKVTPWGQRNLAYPIGKIHTAYYCTVNIKIDSGSVKKLNRLLGLDTDIIRYLIVRGIHELEPDTGNQRTEDRGQKSRAGSRKPEAGSQKTENGERRTEDRGQRTEKIIDEPIEKVSETKKEKDKPKKAGKSDKVVKGKEEKPKVSKKEKKSAKKTDSAKAKKTPAKPKKKEKTDDERLKQLENKLQDLLKE